MPTELWMKTWKSVRSLKSNMLGWDLTGQKVDSDEKHNWLIEIDILRQLRRWFWINTHWDLKHQIYTNRDLTRSNNMDSNQKRFAQNLGSSSLCYMITALFIDIHHGQGRRDLHCWDPIGDRNPMPTMTGVPWNWWHLVTLGCLGMVRLDLPHVLLT